MTFDQAKVGVVLPDESRRFFDLEHPETGRPVWKPLTGIALDADGEPTEASLAVALRSVHRQGAEYARAVEPHQRLGLRAARRRATRPGRVRLFARWAGRTTKLTLAANVEAFCHWQLRPPVLVDVAEPSTATTVLGQEVALPVLVAPVAYQRVLHPDGEVGMARAAAAAGTIMCLSTLATAGWDEIAGTGVHRWFQFYVPRDEGLAAELLAGARAHGFGAIVLTVDTPVLGRRERSLRDELVVPHALGIAALARSGLTPETAFEAMSASVTWSDIERFAGLSGLPIVLKGVVTAEDARLACEHGAAAVVVSNHGGRQLDAVAATIDVLAEVVEGVDGRIEVLLDSGIRRGTDVIKALALGARAVLAGRAPVWGLAVDGERGAGRVLDLLRAEIALALQLVSAGRSLSSRVRTSHAAGERSRGPESRLRWSRLVKRLLLVIAIALAASGSTGSAAPEVRADACGVPDQTPIWVDFGGHDAPIPAEPGETIAVASGTDVPQQMRTAGAATVLFDLNFNKRVGTTMNPADPSLIDARAQSACSPPPRSRGR